ncbi:hypothetical protein VZC37_04745 [Gordonia sp. LSe1-13]|uniref:Mce family protein n=1 Tax=Gordonia sesuvii TaxID=3116777 RepID=A0ABU7M990_9ACTN|nr:hypothetical protein [Gordonia sp. LSe1-13]
MAKHILVGVNTEQHSARVLGIAFVLVAVLAIAAWRVLPDSDEPGPGDLRITLITETIGAGIETGTEVWRHGVKVGSVRTIERRDDEQFLTIDLAAEDVRGLTEQMSIDFAPANLFGITQISLRDAVEANAAEFPLRNGATIDLTGAQRGRVDDATMSTMLEGLGALTDRVLTPQFTELVDKVARNSKEFTPMIQMIVGVSATVWRTQEVPFSPILRGFGEGFKGAPPTLSGILHLLDVVYKQPYLKSPENRERFDATTGMLANGLIPGVAEMLRDIRPYYHDLAQLPPPMLNAFAHSVGTPSVTAGDLRTLLDRLSRSFRDSPAGPVLRLALALDLTPSAHGGTGPGR